VNALLQANGLSIGYKIGRRERVIAADLNVAVRGGEMVCLVGPNGAGKSTLLRTLAGMQPPLAGQVLLEGAPLVGMGSIERAQRIAVVLTSPVDVDYMTAEEIIALGRYPYTGISGRLNEADRRMVAWALKAVGAEALASRPLRALSDGERQKVMIARGLAQEPALLLLDEPTAYLDLTHRAEMMRLLRLLAREGVHGRPLGVLLSTHELDLSLRSADQMWLMQKGRPLQTGAPDALLERGAFQAAFGAAFDELVWPGKRARL
jgi:iron complex transport system ATP-binding protein